MVLAKRLARDVGVLALLAAMTACSSSSGKAATKNSSVSTAAAGSESAAGSPIRVGMLCSCSGPYGSLDSAGNDVARAWISSTNASGGLGGHPIDFIFEDDDSSAATAITGAQKLISDHVAVIIDFSNFEPTWASAVAAAKIPVVAGGFGSSLYYTNPDFFPPGTTRDAEVFGVADTAKRAGATNMGMLYCVEAIQCAEGVAPQKAASKQVGVPVKYAASISATAPNYTAQCVASEQGKVQALWIGEGVTTAASVAADCNQQGYDPIYEVDGSAYAMTLPSTGMKTLAVAFQLLPFFSDAPEMQAMNAAVDKYYPGLRSGHGAMWSQYAVGGWAAGLLIRDGLKGSGISRSGTVTAAAMTQGLDSLKNDTLDGFSPSLTFTAGQPHKVDCWFAAEWTNGSRTLLNHGQAICQSGSTS